MSLKAEGNIEIIGPDVISLGGGMGGVYVRSKGCGSAKLIITDNRGEATEVRFEVVAEDE